MKKKIIGIFVCTLLIATVLFVSGNVLLKRASNPVSAGDILYVGGTGPGNYSSIQEAINDTVDGDTVYVYDDSSPYVENVVVDKSIVLQGEDKETTIVDGSGVDSVIHVSVKDVEITGFTVINSGSMFLDAGIDVFRTDSCIVVGNIISDCHNGISLYVTSDNTVSGNTITDNDRGIRASGKRSSITRNTIQNNQRGMYLNGANFNEIVENNFMDNEGHFNFYGALFNKIDGNYWEGNTMRVKILFGIPFALIPLPGFLFDWHPASEPYDLGGRY